MFNPLSWFRSKKTQRKPLDFIDIHAHYLPGVDDGPPNLERTVRMLKTAYDTGTRSIVATPHMFLDPYNNCNCAAIRTVFQQTLSVLREENRAERAFLGDLQLYLGAENYASRPFLESLDRGEVLTINGTRYLLVEFPPSLTADRLENVLERVWAGGFTPVVAHVERLRILQSRPAYAERLQRLGCILQVNGGSFVRKPLRRTCRVLLDRGFIKVIASDGHSSRWRPPDLSLAHDWLLARYSEDQCQSWLRDNPGRILADEEDLV